MIRKIPLTELFGACKPQLDLVRKHWPDGIPITRTSADKANALGLNVDWAAKRLLPGLAWQEYHCVMTKAWQEFQRVTATARQKYKLAKATARQDYKRVSPEAKQEYDRATAIAWPHYQRVTAYCLLRLLRKSRTPKTQVKPQGG